MGYKLSNTSLYKKVGNGFKKVSINTEKDVFKVLKLKYIEPRHRVF